MLKMFLNMGTAFLLAAVVCGVASDTNKYSGPDSNFISSTWKAAGSGDVWAVLCLIFSVLLLGWIVYRLYKAWTNKDKTSGYIHKGPGQ